MDVRRSATTAPRQSEPQPRACKPKPARVQVDSDSLAGAAAPAAHPGATCWRWASATATCASATWPTTCRSGATWTCWTSSATRCSASSTAASNWWRWHIWPISARAESNSPYAEFGVSVASHLRGRGYGDRLFDHAALHARNRGIDTLLVHALEREHGHAAHRAQRRRTRRARRAGVAGLGQARRPKAWPRASRPWSKTVPPTSTTRLKRQAQRVDGFIAGLTKG